MATPLNIGDLNAAIEKMNAFISKALAFEAAVTKINELGSQVARLGTVLAESVARVANLFATVVSNRIIIDHLSKMSVLLKDIEKTFEKIGDILEDIFKEVMSTGEKTARVFESISMQVGLLAQNMRTAVPEVDAMYRALKRLSSLPPVTPAQNKKESDDLLPPNPISSFAKKYREIKEKILKSPELELGKDLKKAYDWLNAPTKKGGTQLELPFPTEKMSLISRLTDTLRKSFQTTSQFFSGKFVPALSQGFNAVKTAVVIVGRVMMANPILLIIGLIAGAAFLIFKNWDKIKQWFSNLWIKVKEIFWKVVAWIKEYGLLLLGPVGFIIKNWDKIKAYFTQLWPKIKEKFWAFIDFVKTLPAKMFEAGKNIVKSIWEGIKAFASKPIEAIKGMVSKIRDYLPFSPAKEGALRDIHRIKLVETIAGSVKPGPLVKAMRSTVAAAMSAAAPIAGKFSTQITGVKASVSGTFTYAPVINIQGSVDANIEVQFKKQLEQNAREIFRVYNQQFKREQRTSF